MINVVNDNNHSQSHPTWRRERPIKTLEKRGKSHVEQVWGKGTLIASALDWLLVKMCYAGYQAMICRTLYSGHKTKNEKPKRFQAICVSFLAEIQSECVFQLFLFYSQAAMYKKSPPSEADCLLLALELLYVWRALYTCSETVLNRILTGKSFFCSAHYILRSLSVTWRKLSCVTYSVSQQK